MKNMTIQNKVEMMNGTQLGVIGGMGPKATSVFFDRVIEFTEAEADQDHIDMIILNHASLPDRTSSILQRKDHQFLRMIQADIALLEHAEVANIAMPCNTAHRFFDALQSMTAIPIVNMVSETVEELHAKHKANRRIGILATDATLQTGIYSDVLRQYGLEPFIPSASMQQRIMNIIYEDIKKTGHSDARVLEGIMMEMLQREKCDGVVLACTELSCIELGESVRPYFIDALDVLVHRSITLSGGTIKPAIMKRLSIEKS
ncbi:aspartate/glutamate racemase family protein [Cohnella lupini]|nr:amino acid racemase [Cohnella lupini]